MNSPILLSNRDITEMILQTGLDALIGRLEQALVDYKKDAYSIPARDGFCYSEPHTGLIEWMPLMRR